MVYVLSIVAYLLLTFIVLILFLLSIVSSISTGHYYISVLKLFITFFLIYELHNEFVFYLNKKRNQLKILSLESDDLYVFIAVIIGGLFTYFINHDLALGAVLASCIIGIFGAMMLKKYQVPLFCGSFAGMVSSTIITSYWGILIVGVFAGILFVISKNVFKGFGGKLGATAFFGTTISAVIFSTISSTMVSSAVSLDYWLILYFSVGAAGTYLLSAKLKLSVVFASALMGLLGAIVLPMIHGNPGVTLAVGLFCGTFIGMSSVERLYNLRSVLLASLLGAVIFSYTQPYFTGLGGKLGAIAFGSSIASAGIFNLTSRIKNEKRQL